MPIIRSTMQRTTAYDAQHWYYWLWLGRAGPPVVCALRKLLFEQLSHSAHNWRPSSTRPQPAIPVLYIIYGSSLHCTPDDGHTDARNMLRWINFIVASSWIITLPMFTDYYNPRALHTIFWASIVHQISPLNGKLLVNKTISPRGQMRPRISRFVGYKTCS
jgi:hypothetical protein